MPIADEGEFRGLRFLDFDDYLGGGENFLGRIDDAPAGGAIALVVESDGGTGGGLYEYFVATMDGFAHRGWRHPDAVLVDLDLFGNAQSHPDLPHALSDRFGIPVRVPFTLSEGFRHCGVGCDPLSGSPSPP